MSRATIVVGTTKGGFVVESDPERRRFRVEGPFFKGWKVTAIARDSAGTWLAGAASDVYGCAIHRSPDLEEWKQVTRGPAYAEGGDAKLTQIWRILAGKSRFYAGVADAGLFQSDDRGDTWEPIDGLNRHRTRGAWFPGNGGLCAHSILVDPRDERRLWCGISAVGVFRSDDGGATWKEKNGGVPVIIEDKEHKEIGYCVHAIAHDPRDSNTIYRQDHRGMFRTRDAGDSWQRIERGLESGFGFPLTIDRRTGALYAVTLESDEYRVPAGGRFCVFRSRDGGDSWHALTKGLPQANYWGIVLRAAVDADHLDPPGIYVGTTSGDLFASRDGGDSWSALPVKLPRILCVTAVGHAA